MYVCGQEGLLKRIDHLIDTGNFPRFCIIVAGRGYGKKVISEYIAKRLNATFAPCGSKAEDTKEVVHNSYTIAEKTLYMFFDCDDMSINAKNAILKVTEEPPNNSYFVMTFQNIENCLNTLVSRGTVFTLDQYTQADLEDYIEHKKYKFTDKTKSIIKQICTCPEDIQTAYNMDIESVYSLADKFIQFIGSANLANELKIISMLNIKKEDKDKIDPIMFLRCILLCCNNYIIQPQCSKEDIKVFHNIIKETSKALCDLSKKGCSKQIVLDNWIISTHMAITGGEF